MARGNLVYGLDDRPRADIALLLALQHASIIGIGLLFPVLLVRAGGGDMADAVRLVSASMLAGGLGTCLQALGRAGMGSGFLCPTVCGPSYLAASLLAVKTGGLALVFGMTSLAALGEVLFSRVMRFLRPMFPAEVTGLIVVMAGLSVVKMAARNFFALPGGGEEVTWQALVLAIGVLALMVGLNVWGRGRFRLFCALAGMAAGYVLAIPLGFLGPESLEALRQTPWFALPLAGHPGWAFDPGLVGPFMVAMLSTSLKSVGDLTTCQRINDPKWTRPDMDNLGRGILADGLGALGAGLLGGFGQSTSSANIGLSMATGAVSRAIAFWTGGLLAVLAFCPRPAALFALMPPPVIGATLIFVLSFMITAGMQIIMTRMMDVRKTFVVGLSLIFGLSVDILPGVYAQAPAWFQPVVSSSLSASTIMAVLLNLVFRLGIARTAILRLGEDFEFADRIFNFMEKQGGLWGARPEVIRRAASAMTEAMEAIIGVNGGMVPVEMRARFDEYHLDIRIFYRGRPLDLEAGPPSPASITLDGPDPAAAMAVFLMQHYCSDCRMEERGGVRMLHLHFVH